MNSNSLPIALMQSLVVSVPDLAWGSTDNRDAMLGRALTYLTVYSTLGMVVCDIKLPVMTLLANVMKVRYSYGVNLLSRADTALVLPSRSVADGIVESEPTSVSQSSKSKQRDLIDLSESADAPSEVENNSRLAIHSRSTSLTNQVTIFAEPSSSSLLPVKHVAAFYTFPNTPNDSNLTLARPESIQGYSGESDDESDEASSLLQHDLPRPNTEGHHLRQSPVIQILRRIRHRITRTWIAIRDFMTAPLWAALLSLIVAFIDPIKHALEHHMQPLNHAINTAGKCAIPLTLVVLGAYFHEPASEGEGKRVAAHRHDKSESTWRRIFCLLRTTPKDSSEPTKQARPGETKTVVLAIFARMILTPLLLVPFLMLASKYDWQAVFEE
jgi:predicted permease